MPEFSDSWGDNFPITEPDWDLIIASDILLCIYLFSILAFANIKFYYICWVKNVT